MEKYTKLITDSDTDGLVCAAMLLRVFPDVKVYFSSPSYIQDKTPPTPVDEGTIISDLPFIEGCGLYFDHHASNQPKVKFNGVWKIAPSAARIIFEYYKDQVPLTDFKDFLPALDKFDEGSLTREDVANPSFYTKLCYATKKVKHQFYKHIMELLVEEGPTALPDDMMVLQEIGQFDTALELMKHDIHNVVDKRGDIVFVNLIDKPYSSIHVSLIQNELIDSKIFVVYKKDKNATRVTLYDNNLIQDSRMYDLLSIAQKMNPLHAGGHKGGCGFSMPEGMTIAECSDKLTELINKIL